MGDTKKMDIKDTTESIDHIKLSMPNKPEYVSVIRLTTSAIASRMGFNIDEIDDIKVAIGEACTNAIQHGTNKENNTYDIEFFVYIDRLQIQIKDRGRGFNTSEVKQPKAEDLKERGLGLFIIKTLMDDVECISNEDTGTEIRMTKRIGVG